jgi:mannose-1-phosphate guanylyltransferase/mannose-6-phosphate isomerase
VINKIIPVVLSGGSGTRLWPLSRSEYPKQYLRLIGENTMIQETILRLKGLSNLSSPIVIASYKHRFLVAEQLLQIDIESPTIILEPCGRNTAPAIAASAITISKDGGDKNILLVLPADHEIQDVALFHKAIESGLKQAKAGKLVTFGIVPTSANTNYGYIKKSGSNEDFYEVDKFIEKPNQKEANGFFEKKDFLWNSGMFMFQANTLIEELSKHCPEISNKIKYSVENAKQDLNFTCLEESSFESCPNNSIDYELMEKSDNVVVVPLDAGWSDIGSWTSLYDSGTQDTNGNVINGDIISQDTTNCFIHSDQNMVATIGLKDMFIVNTPDVTFISTKKDLNQVSKIIDQLRNDGRKEHSYHRKVYRPWGWYDSIESGSFFQVKRLHVNPGAKLSLQFHNKRAEHWVVVKGVASVTNGDEEIRLTKGMSTYIPNKVKHSLSNMENSSLEVIEIQSGLYLGEDDIVRLEDIYGRC